MAFPDIRGFPTSHPGPYELQMGGFIAGLPRLFASRVPDSESTTRVLELASDPPRWSAEHAVFDEVRQRLLGAAAVACGHEGQGWAAGAAVCLRGVVLPGLVQRHRASGPIRPGLRVLRRRAGD